MYQKLQEMANRKQYFPQLFTNKDNKWNFRIICGAEFLYFLASRFTTQNVIMLNCSYFLLHTCHV